MTDHDQSVPRPRRPLPPVRDQSDLDRTWRTLMGPLGFAAPQVWVLLLADRVPGMSEAERAAALCGAHVLHLVKFEEVPLRLGADDLERLSGMVAELVAVVPGVEAAFLYARPGGSMRTPADLAWARALAELSPWPVHLANDVDLRVATLDDLGETG